MFNRSPAATIYNVFSTIVDTSSEQTVQINEPVGFNLSPTDVIFFEADTNTNAAQISVRLSLRSYKRT